MIDTRAAVIAGLSVLALTVLVLACGFIALALGREFLHLGSVLARFGAGMLFASVIACVVILLWRPRA